MSRLVFLDVDGTLLNHHQEMPESARRALDRALSLGHQLILCTGRSVHEIYPFLWDIGFRGFIGCNGAYGELDGTIVFNDHIPAEEVEEITAWLDSVEASGCWQSGTGLHPIGNFFDLFRPPSHTGQGARGNWIPYLEQIRPYLHDGVPTTAAKATFFLPPGSSVTLADMQERFGDRFTIVGGSLSHGHGATGELTARGVSKAAGLKKLASHLGVRVDETIAVGDSANDIEMLRLAGTGVAMGNGTPEAKASADWVTDCVDDGGLALAFDRLGLLTAPESGAR